MDIPNPTAPNPTDVCESCGHAYSWHKRNNGGHCMIPWRELVPPQPPPGSPPACFCAVFKAPLVVMNDLPREPPDVIDNELPPEGEAPPPEGGAESEIIPDNALPEPEAPPAAREALRELPELAAPAAPAAPEHAPPAAPDPPHEHEHAKKKRWR